MSAQLNSQFTTSTHGKWILAGEHAVLRGGDALVFPLKNQQITLSYQPNDLPLDAEFKGPYAEPMLLVFWGLLEEGLKHLGQRRDALSGKFYIHNTIPVGMGLGFSAALCVVVTRWFVHQGWLADHTQQLFEFAKQLEDHCHGVSSGVDVVGSLCELPQVFSPPSTIAPLELAWQPHLYLSHVGPISVTAQCIQEVAALAEHDPARAAAIDQQMMVSVVAAREALASRDAGAASALAHAIEQAANCFADWGLLPAEVEVSRQQLLNAGALAVKPTGAGCGGYLLSLWALPPADDLTIELGLTRAF